ncbi:RNA polymerase sigma-70 factor, sigma-E family [Parafrankia irregularis]|uniref:RNA polymerase sigma-70 factor, sigma-E family n=1 Tax=Parafrankia irregularis TaxID=795642 RepID=A0A0S4QWA0_9ACTN|nr:MULTISPECIES: SigE family RNA polymerase sigma factor [Parafrankia]MBE3201931.1 SigE family RNA polymerase sigma factor [Parafrankia sp. CH37]CUU59481.1 RNA polymerase sigma-70 factor, sigma-E family [Parafrankia irregularis]
MHTDEGDSDGFTAYFAPRAAGLLRFAYLLTGDAGEAEELTQTTLVRMFVVWPRVRGHDRPDAYARRVMVNANARRFRHRRVRQVLVDVPPERAEPSSQLAAVEDRVGLAAALATLPPRQRAVVVLRYCEDRPEAEVAALLRCSAGTVKSQAAKGLAKLRSHPAVTGLGPGSASGPDPGPADLAAPTGIADPVGPPNPSRVARPVIGQEELP